ncbi:MAG: tetratricopeptide repeat protein [Deltaproteobacteria bacterium]
MVRGILYIYFLFWFSSSFCQEFIEEVSTGSQEVDLESNFILAMQDVVLEKYDDAIEKLRKLSKLTPEEGITEFQIAQILLKQNKTEDAMFQAKKAYEKNPDNIHFKQLLQDIYEKTGDFKSAAELMERIITDHKFDRKEYFELAELYSKANDIDKAIEVLENLDKKAGFDVQTDFQKISLLIRFKNYEHARKIAEQLDKRMPGNSDVMLKLAMIYRLTDDARNMELVYQKILKTDPQNPQALSYFSTRKKINQSDKNYFNDLAPYLNNMEIGLDEKILTLAPYVESLTSTNPIYNDLKNAAEILLKLYPNSAKTNALYADILYNSGEVGESAGYYRKSLKYEKGNFLVWKQLMIIYTNQEDWSNLEKLSIEAIDFYPNHALPYYYAGRANFNTGKLIQAHEYLDESSSLSLQNEKFLNEILLMKANVFISEKNVGEASKILEKLNEQIKNNHPFYFELCGDIEVLKGDRMKAIQYWQKSVSLGNNSIRLAEKMKNQ